MNFLGLSSFIGTNETIIGVYKTSAGGDSTEAIPGVGVGVGVGTYPGGESPNKACDNDVNTKYLTSGSCDQNQVNNDCGKDTGLYLTPNRGASLVLGLQVCTANDYLNRDPMTVTLEGSNHTGINLTLGTSWSLIYNGSSGLLFDLCRKDCGDVQYFSNLIWYTSYRFLIVSKRGSENSVQYSELQLFGN